MNRCLQGIIGAAIVCAALSAGRSIAAPVDASALEAFLQVPEFSLDGFDHGPAVEGSALRQTFTAQAGDILSFDYSFLAGELQPPTGVNDFAIVSINPLVAALLSDVGGSTNPAPGTGFLGQSGYSRYFAEILQAGTYRLGIGIVDVTDETGDSGLLIDNLRLERGGAPVTGAFANPSFETAFTGFETTGDAFIRTASFGVAPTDGTSQALLTTGPSPIPEPSTLAPVCAGILGLGCLLRRRAR